MINFSSNLSKSSNINIRKEFQLLQKQFSLDILYIRTNKYIRCECYNPLHKIGVASCHKCLGRGYLNTIEKIPAITHSSNYSQDGISDSRLGLILASDDTFYLDIKAMPRVGDIIVVAKYNQKGEPVEGDLVHEIHTVSPIRGDNGRVELYCVNTKLRDDKLFQVDKIIRQFDHRAKTYLAKGKRYIWAMQEN